MNITALGTKQYRMAMYVHELIKLSIVTCEIVVVVSVNKEISVNSCVLCICVNVLYTV